MAGNAARAEIVAPRKRFPTFPSSAQQIAARLCCSTRVRRALKATRAAMSFAIYACRAPTRLCARAQELHRTNERNIARAKLSRAHSGAAATTAPENHMGNPERAALNTPSGPHNGGEPAESCGDAHTQGAACRLNEGGVSNTKSSCPNPVRHAPSAWRDSGHGTTPRNPWGDAAAPSGRTKGVS